MSDRSAAVRTATTPSAFSAAAVSTEADPGVRHRAVQDRAVEHAGQPEVAGELGLAGELEPAVGAFHALSYGGPDGGHSWPPRISVSESRIET